MIASRIYLQYSILFCKKRANVSIFRAVISLLRENARISVDEEDFLFYNKKIHE